MKFSYYAPTKVYFGRIDYDDLISEIRRFGDKVLVLTGCVNSLEHAKSLAEKLGKDFTVTIKSGIKSNPEIEYIEQLAKELSKIDVILTVGGGSVHDSGKALAIAMTHMGDLEEYTTDGKRSVLGINNKTIPVITIPTIYGTGAEVSPAALIRIKNKKRIIFSTYIYPKATFIDCSLAMSLSNEICIKAALDAMVQGIESVVSTKAQSFSKRFSYSAIQRTVSGLLVLAKEKRTIELMEQLALASVEGLYAVGQSSVGAAHAISDPISGRFDIHHGEAVGILLPYVVEANYSNAKNEYDTVKQMFEKELNQKFESLYDALNAFYSEIGFNRYSLQNNTIKDKVYKDYNNLIAESYNGDMDGNPIEMTDAIIGDILNKAFGVNEYEIN